MRLRAAGVALVLVGLSGCGTTVPFAQREAAPTDALGAPAPAVGGTPATPTPQGSRGAAGAPVAVAPGVPVGTHAGQAPGASLPPLAGATDHGPLQVGILTTNNDAASGAGVDNGNSFTPRRAYAALVAAWNARGGVGGRRVDPVHVEIRSSSSDLSTDLERACSAFTQDRHVAVVLVTTGFFDEGFSQCLARVGTPVVATDYALGDADALRAASTLVAPSTLTTDDRAVTLLRRMTALGRFGRSTRLGVVVEGCSYNRRTYDRTLVPLATRLGIAVASHEETRCFRGLPDLGGQAAELQSVVLRFRSARVTDVVFVSGSMEGNLMLLFGTAAQSQQYQPHYALTSGVSAVVQEGNTPSQQLQNAVGVGWLPDVDSDRPGPVRAVQRRCLQDVRRGGLDPSGAVDRTYAYDACDAMSLLDAALRTGAGSLLAAVQSLGRRFVSTTTYGGTTDFSGGRRTGPATGRVFAWRDGCSCFDYTGPSFDLTPQEPS